MPSLHLQFLIFTISIGSLIIGVTTDAAEENDQANPVIRENVTLEECVAHRVQAELVACFEKLNERNAADITMLAAREKSIDEENSKLDERIASDKKRVITLSKEAEEATKWLEKRIFEPDNDTTSNSD